MSVLHRISGLYTNNIFKYQITQMAMAMTLQYTSMQLHAHFLFFAFRC